MFGGANVKVVGKEKNLFVSRKGCKVKAVSYKLQAVSFFALYPAHEFGK